MLYFLCLSFWTGLFLILFKNQKHIGLRERALVYYGEFKQKTKNSDMGMYIQKRISEFNKDKYSKELLDSLVYTKNLVALNQGSCISAAALFEELAGVTKLLAPCFTQMAFYMHTNNISEASGCLYKYFGTDYAKDIGNFLAGWEEVAPEKLTEMINAYIESLRSQQLARSKQKDEIISDLIYFPVVINCMAVLLNFVYIAFFIEQQDMFQMIF